MNSGYYITYFATGIENDWNCYYTWSVRKDIDKLCKDPNNQKKNAEKLWMIKSVITTFR